MFQGDEMVGCYGISGATSGQDEEIGAQTRAKAGWANRPATDDMPEEAKAHVNAIYKSLGLDRSL